MNRTACVGALRCVFAVLLLYPAYARGQDQPLAPVDTLLNLDSLLVDVRMNNPSLRASRLEAQALLYTGSQVSSLPEPTFMVTWAPYPVHTARGTMRSQWRVEQMFPFPGIQGIKDDIAALSAEVAGFEAKTFELDLLFRVKQSYYELYRIQRQQTLIRAFQNRLESFAEGAAFEYEVGQGMQQAVLKAQLERNTLTQRSISLDEQRTTVIETLARLTDKAIPDLAHVDLVLETPSVPDFNADTLLTLALEQRPEVDALEAAAKRAERRVALADKEFWPDFGVNVTYFDIADSDIPPAADGRNALAIGASVKIPLWRGSLHAKRDEALVRQAQVSARQDALRTAFRTQISDLVSRLRQEARQLELYRTALIPQAETTLEATLSAYTTGRTDFLDLLDAERMLFSLGTGYEDARARYLKTSAALERAIGIMDLRQLGRL